MKFIFDETTNKNQFSTRRRTLTDIKFIVVHDTGNTSKGANANAHKKYLDGAKRYGSAHYFVDDTSIIQVIGDSKIAWGVGDNQGYGRFLNGCTNNNSISIEMCINQDGDYSKTYFHTVELVKHLMKKFNIPLERVVRHYDASRKCCPCHMSKNNWAAWYKFKEDIQQPPKLLMNTDQDSEAVPVGEMAPPQTAPTDDTKKDPQKEDAKVEYFEKNNLKIIKAPANQIYIQQLGGKTLREVGAYGINGTFYDTPNPHLTRSTWQIAVNNGKPIGENAHTNGYDGKRRATMIYGEGRITVERINNISEIKRKVTWAIGGVGLYPSYDPKLEKVEAGILNTTAHTAMAFRGTTVYLIVSPYISISQLRREIEKLGVDGAILLDGGRSTQMYWKGNQGIHTERKLNHMVGVK